MPLGAIRNRFSRWLGGGRERRRTPRETAPPMVLEIAGREYRTENWSLGGFAIAGFAGEARPGDRLPARHAGRDAPEVGAFEVEVVWRGRSGRLGLRLIAADGVDLAGDT